MRGTLRRLHWCGQLHYPYDRETRWRILMQLPDERRQQYLHLEYNATNKRRWPVRPTTVSIPRWFAYPVRVHLDNLTSGVTNLSRVQTATLFVSESGHYKLQATYAATALCRFCWQNNDGNAHSGHVGDGDDGQHNWHNKDHLLAGAGRPQRYNNTAGTDCPIELVSTQPDAEGYIQFGIDTDRFSKGNAILAAFDSSNNILWTWHIWLTDTPDDVVTGDYTVMDRNLGATYVPTSTSETWSAAKRLATYGFYYQWGRKDHQGPSSYKPQRRALPRRPGYYKIRRQGFGANDLITALCRCRSQWP